MRTRPTAGGIRAPPHQQRQGGGGRTFVVGHFGEVEPDNVLPRLPRGPLHHDLLVEAPGPDEGGVENVGRVGGGWEGGVCG